MQRYRSTVEYLGAKYCGMQKQADSHLPTIQGKIEAAMKKMFNFSVEIGYAGRTDAGVNALGQIIHFDLPLEINVTPHRITHGLNFFLRDEEIAIRNTVLTLQNFDARFDALLRRYKYYVNLEKTKPVSRKLTHYHFPLDVDVDKMKLAAQRFLGRHDFSAFRSSDCQAKNPVRTIQSLDLELSGTELIVSISAQSFLHNMVRIIVGTLLDVGRGKIDAEDLPGIIKSGDRKLAGHTAKAHGLWFFEVIYPEN